MLRTGEAAWQRLARKEEKSWVPMRWRAAVRIASTSSAYGASHARSACNGSARVETARARLARRDDAVVVLASNGAEARVNIVRYRRRIDDRYIAVLSAKVPVEAALHFVRRERLAHIDVKRIRQRVHAFVGAARSDDAIVVLCPNEAIERVVQRCLHRSVSRRNALAVQLACPPDVRRPHVRYTAEEALRGHEFDASA